MRTRNIAKYALITMIIFGVLTGVVLTRGQDQDAQVRRSTPEEHHRAIDAARRGGLREAAKIKGSFVVTDYAKAGVVYSGLEALASHSSAVIVGTAAQTSANSRRMVSTLLPTTRL